MGDKSEFLFGEALISTAFLGGVWTALQVDPEVVMVEALAEVIAVLAGPDAASQYVFFSNLLLFIGFLVVVGMVFAIGRMTGLVAFGLMWLAGLLFIQESLAGVLLLFMGWGVGALAILMHTDEQVTTARPAY